MEEYFEIDSAGTSGWHIGKPADQRMQTHAVKRNYHLTSLGRKFDKFSDFDHFDRIIAMDDNNLYDLKQKARNKNDLKKLSKMTDFCKKYNYNEVPDPYYGGAEGFELVLDLLEDSCEGLLKNLLGS